MKRDPERAATSYMNDDCTSQFYYAHRPRSLSCSLLVNNLKELVKSIPEVKDILFGLLIGNNCQRALEPMQIIASQDEGPYAERTRMGWCVVGTALEGNETRVGCNAIKVMGKSSTNLRGETVPVARKMVIQTQVKDNDIAETLERMWKTDFVEKQGEDRAMSKEDRTFMQIMRDNVTFKDGHYVLPLPIRRDKEFEKSNEDDIEIVSPNEVGETPKKRECKIMENGKIMMPENRDQALQRLKSSKRRMQKDPGYKREYWEFMTKLTAKGYARKVPKETQNQRAWFLTHHGVRHPTNKYNLKWTHRY